MDDPSLIIPVRFDYKNAARDLKQVEQQGAAAGNATAKGFDNATGSAKGFFSAMAGMQAVQSIAGATKDVMQGVGQQLQEAGDHTRKLAREFAELRQSMQQIAALTGRANTNAFTLEQTRAAAAASLKPEEWVKFQEEFQSRAGAYLEGDQQRLAGDQAEKYQAQIAEFAKARGIAPSEAAALGGGLLQFSEGMQDPAKLMERYGKVFKTLERAPTPVAQLLPQMSRVMSQGFSPEEASQALAIMSEAMPGEEETGVENALKALINVRLEGKGEEIGISKGMTPMQMLEAASKKLKERVAGGEDVDELMKQYAPDLRERRGLLGFMNRGIGAGGFERVRGYGRETPADFVEKSIAEYETSDSGQAAKRAAQLASIEAERGARQQALQAEMERAELSVVGAGELERPEGILAGIETRAGQTFGQGDRRQQEIRALAARNLRQGLEGYAGGREWLGQGQRELGLAMGRGAPDELLAQAAAELKRLRELAEKNDRQREQQGQVPLVAPPPNPAGRMGG